MFSKIKSHLQSNSGDTNVSKMIMVAIVFVVGAIVLVLTTSAFQGPVKGWYDNVVYEWFRYPDVAYCCDICGAVCGGTCDGSDDSSSPELPAPDDGNSGIEGSIPEQGATIPPDLDECWCGIPGCDGCHNEPGGTDH